MARGGRRGRSRNVVDTNPTPATAPSESPAPPPTNSLNHSADFAPSALPDRGASVAKLNPNGTLSPLPNASRQQNQVHFMSSFALMVDPNEGTKLNYVPTQLINEAMCAKIETKGVEQEIDYWQSAISVRFWVRTPPRDNERFPKSHLECLRDRQNLTGEEGSLPSEVCTLTRQKPG